VKKKSRASTLSTAEASDGQRPNRLATTRMPSM